MKRSAIIPLHVLALLPALLLLFSCQPDRRTGDNTRRAVDPLLSTTVPFRHFEIDVAAGDTIRLEEGTSICIPAGIFVDASGAPVNGKVQLYYRAFYTPGEILASGITMLYDTAGREQLFTSAGMFQIYGTQDSRPVSIAPGKSIGMDFASTYNDADFHFYELDTTKAAWSFLGKSPTDTNALRKKLLKALASFPRRPVEPKEYNSSKPVLNIDVDVSDHPELAGYNNILWQYAGSGSDPKQNSWIYSAGWTSAKLLMKDTNQCVYGLTLSDGRRRFSTDVVPVLKGDDYTAAINEFRTNMLAFEAKERERVEKQKQLARTTGFMQRLKLTRFGIFNLDIFNIFGNPDWTEAEFHFEDQAFERARENVMVYAVTADGRLATGYRGNSENAQLSFVPAKNTCLIAVLLGTTKAAVLTNGEFNSMLLDKRDRHAPGKKSVFTLRPTSHPVAGAEDIDDLISKL